MTAPVVNAPYPPRAFTDGLAHLRAACVELNLASGDLNEATDYTSKDPYALLSLKEWHAIFRTHKRLQQTYRRLLARVPAK